SAAAGNTILGNVLFVKNGANDFRASSKTVSSISGNYEFHCNNGLGSVQLFIDGTTSIGGNFSLIDSIGANTQLGNNTNTTLISGKVDIDYNGNALHNGFLMFKLKNMING